MTSALSPLSLSLSDYHTLSLPLTFTPPLNTQAVDFSRDVLSLMRGELHIAAYPFHGYWEDVGSLKDYYAANMAMAADVSDLRFLVFCVGAAGGGVRGGQLEGLLRSKHGHGSRRE